jgi:predicted nucleic acid-binding protein
MPAGVALEERLFEADETLHAPHLLDVEVAQVLRRYVALAEALEAPLLTRDQRLANAPGHGARVEVV